MSQQAEPVIQSISLSRESYPKSEPKSKLDSAAAHAAVNLELEPAQNLAQTRGFSLFLIPNIDPESIYSLDCTGSLL